jgi:hypothetical protein
LDQCYVYRHGPWLGDIVVELMGVDEGFVVTYDCCAREIQSWDGSDPRCLVSV